MTNTETLAQKLTVSAAVDTYVEMLNSLHNLPQGYTFTAEPSGSKYRIVMHNGQDSVHSFVDATTGDLFKAAGWKVAAKGVRFNLLTEMEMLRYVFTTNPSNWAGAYLYADVCKNYRAAYAQVTA